MKIGNDAMPDGVGTRPRVLCAGQVALDLFVPSLTSLPSPGELLMIDEMLTGIGGCSANTAIALGKLGVPAVLSAMVGDDAQATWIRQALASQALAVDRLTTSERLSTSQTVVLPVRGEDRRYIHSIGANAEYSAAHIAPHLEGIDVLVIGGFLSLPRLTGVGLTELLAQARFDGVRTVLDVVIARGTRDTASEVRSVLPYVDCFTPNHDEATVLTGEHSPERQAQILLSWGCKAVAITRGAEGVFFADGHRTVQVLPPSTAFVDGSGAGDAFTAGLVFAMLQDWPIDRRLQFATAIGASVTRGLGTTRTLYSLEEALAQMKSVLLVEPIR